MDSSEAFLERIYNYSLHKTLPAKKKFSLLTRECVDVLKNEDSSYRPRTTIAPNDFYAPVGTSETEGTFKAGGLLDFRGTAIPTIVVPDIHARPDFIYNILRYVLPKKISGLKKSVRVIDALENGSVCVVLVGDILHGEARVCERWGKALKETMNGETCGANMRAEMREGLGALMAIMECKKRWPKNFHCLKGNHENIKNESRDGNWAFRKFVYEGEMVFRFMLDSYGPEIIEEISNFEKSLPLAYCADNLIVSHAEPLEPLDEETIINAPLFSDIILALTWTANDEARDGSVKKMLDEICAAKEGVRPIYIGGHRPVMGKYNLRQDGLYVQIHNPMEQNIAVVRTDKTFNPETDVVSVENI